MIKLPTRPKKIHRNRPKLLLDGTIPRPMHGVNPRSIMGKKWWDEERKRAFEYNNYHCHCCGVYKRDAKFFSWLEGHEIYRVDYAKCRMVFRGVVALCHACHAVVHAGRTTQLYLNERMTEDKFDAIVKHGQALFKKYKLDKPIAFRFMELIYQGQFVEDANAIISEEYKDTKPLNLNRWDEWRLWFQGKLYPPKHKTMDAWSDHYSNEDA